MQTKTIVYKGPRPFFAMKEHGSITFHKGLPITVNALLLNHLPSEDFEIFDPKIHKKPDGIKSILLRLPKKLPDILASIATIKKLREYYPYNPIEALSVNELDFVIPKIKDFKIIKSYNVMPGQYFKELNSYISPDNPVFGGAANYKKSREYLFLHHHKLMYGMEPKTLTLLPNRTAKKYITIINLGNTMATVWKELGDFLGKQTWSDDLRVISSSSNIKNVCDTIKQSKYVILTGDSDLAFYAAYHGIPLCAFIPDTKSVYIHQLDFFNQLNKNYVLYSSFVFNEDFKAIYKKLYSVISAVLKGDDLPKAKPTREPLNIDNQGEKRGRTG